MSEALLIVAHGSHLNPRSSAPAQDHADAIRETGAFDEVREAYWKEEPSLRNALRTVTADEVYVVPLFVSEGYFTEEVIPRELRLDFDAADWDSDGTSADSVTCRPSDVAKTVHYCGPVGTHDAMTDVIVRRAETVTGDPDVGEGVGLAVVGHGTKRNENSAKAVTYHADRVRSRGRFDEVRALFMDEEPEIDDVTEHFESDDIVVVPLFVADGYHTQEDIPADMGIATADGYPVPARLDGHDIWYAGAIGTEALMADVILERAADAGADVDRDGDGDGGTDRSPTPADALREAARDGVDFDGLRAARTADGFRFAVPETRYEGLSPEAFAEAARDHRAYVENWLFWHRDAPQAAAEWAFLRWVERADDLSVPERDDRLRDGGLTREWGQVAVTARLTDDGRRRYEVRHVDEADAAREGLSTYTDPAEARRRRKIGDDGDYRPLSTAPTLPHGWAFVDLDATGAVRAVDGLYPATIANWHREREGTLDVTHWHEAVSRQTGIYGVVRTWDRGEGHEHVDRVAEACCDDSQCCKRREWGYDAETPLSVDGGDGVFPCREPCSMVVAAARTWTRLEAERSRTYEFELTPSEKAQLETLVDAVADGRVDGIRDGDTSDGANRFRARYLRAKRFDDEGNLCGVPTDAQDG